MPRAPKQDEVLDVLESLLKAQLHAIDVLRRQRESRSKAAPEVDEPGSGAKRLSQTDMAHKVLLTAEGPLHILEVVSRIQAAFGVQVSRDSLVSAIVKKVARHQEFLKAGKNTYGLRGRDERP
jgi:hypothetical protein